MMTVRVVTCLWGTAWDRYGPGFFNSFIEYWPWDVELVVYSDIDLPIKQRSLWDIPGYGDFLTRWKNTDKGEGRHSQISEKNRWRHHAVKWMPQGITPYAAMSDMSEGDTLIWLDGDVITHSPVTHQWIDKVFGDRAYAYLGREPSHSEIGFMGFRLSQSENILRTMSNTYLHDNWLRLDQSHSAFVFDHARKQHPEIIGHNLSPGGKGHVWPNSVLSECTTHYKGKRKDAIKAS